MAGQLPALERVERLSPRVIRILGGNPGKFTLQGTNTYLIGTGRARILIDTGQGMPEWAESLRSVLSSERATVSEALITHWHHDHTDGVPSLREQCPTVKVYKYSLGEEGEQQQQQQQMAQLDDGQVFETEGASLRAHFCPGHTDDHMAFVLEEEDAMFTGDNVLGHGTAVFSDLTRYMRSLDVMKDQFGGRAYPAHGAVIEQGRDKVVEYIAHRRQRERQVLAVMSGDDGSRGMEAMDMVKVIYKDYPESLHVPAEGGVVQVLEKLRGEGKVKAEGKRWLLDGKAAL